MLYIQYMLCIRRILHDSICFVHVDGECRGQKRTGCRKRVMTVVYVINEFHPSMYFATSTMTVSIGRVHFTSH
ncbi:hypothetical protein GMOD_00007761 [Pyrenophora seminiperda CCB06]|uniref:Uncharacterized protein n=1 Tax=Pyrenophora seminiperda CCB06 TaxID=1302712 RepID=A0A3M7ME36_9PLEO|nr:hypothetical protein GMOD_00007761 [Pyrenophora seminiperda CCB06]